MLCNNKVIQTPVIIPIANANVIRNEGLTAINSKVASIKHIITAKKDAIIIDFLSFIM
jgi:hypothetical protein